MNKLVSNAVDMAMAGVAATPLRAPWSSGSAMRTVNVRMDEESTTELDSKSVAALFSPLLKEEFSDLVVNGETGLGRPYNPDLNVDVWLRTMDGEIVRGKPLTKFEINQVQVFEEYKEKRKRWEYTMFLVFYAEFGNNSDQIVPLSDMLPDSEF